MLVSAIRFSKRRKRSQFGSQIAEFGAGLLILTTLILIPLLDLVIVPIRWMMAQEIVNSYTRKLAMCESLSQSSQLLNLEPSLQSKLEKIGGVSVDSTDLLLRIATIYPSGEVLQFYVPARVPAEWLPNGSKAPCVYSLQLRVGLTIAPALLFNGWGQQITGVTKPIPIFVTASHEWENLGRNPATGEYFLNE
jgi:hypothetical protein